MMDLDGQQMECLHCKSRRLQLLYVKVNKQGRSALGLVCLYCGTSQVQVPLTDEEMKKCQE